MQNFATGTGAFTDDGDLIGVHGDARVSYIDCYDIAACAARLLTVPHRADDTYVLTGPEALSQVEIAARLSAALGRDIRHVELTPAAMLQRLTGQGLPRQFAEDVVELWQRVGTGSLSAVTSAVRELTGRDPRTFDEFLTSAGPISY